MRTTLPWRPISECPPDLRRALVFDPDNVRLLGTGCVDDERVVTADRGEDGAWWVDGNQGGYDVTPTHFLDPGVPDGFPEVVDPEPLRIRAEAERAARAERLRQAEAERARAAAQAVDPGSVRERELEAERERFWADPENLRRHALGGD